MQPFAASNAVILLLDSNPLMRDTLHDALKDAGYLVVTAGGLGRAVDRLKEVQPDLLITRPYINGMTGDIAADYLRTKHPGLPVLIVAGFIEDDRLSVQDAIEQFFTFPKPFSRDEFLAKVKEVLNAIRGRA